MAKQSAKTKSDPVAQAIYAASLALGNNWEAVKSLPERSGQRGWREEEVVSRVLDAPIKKGKDFHGDVLLPNGRAGEVKGVSRTKTLILLDKLPISERLSYRFKRKVERDAGGLKAFEAFFREARYELKLETLKRVYEDEAVIKGMMDELVREVAEDMQRHSIDMVCVFGAHGYMAYVPHERFAQYIELGMIWGNKLRLGFRQDPSVYEPGCLLPPPEWLEGKKHG